MGLPTGYTQLEYLRATGTQKIDTGIIADNTTIVEIKMKSTASGNNYVYILGSTGSKYYYLATWVWAYNTTMISSGINLYDGNEHVVRIEAGGLYVDGTLLKSAANGTFTTDLSMYLFAIHAATDADGFQYIGDIFYCKVWKSGILVRDYLPAERASDGVLGMYDQVSGTLYTNIGTGAFTGGAAVGPKGSRVLIDSTDYEIEAAFAMLSGIVYEVEKGLVLKDGTVYEIPFTESVDGTQLNYIETTGTEYIDTGITPDQDTRIVLTFELITLNANSSSYIVGARSAWLSNMFCVNTNGIGNTGSNFQFMYNYGIKYFSCPTIQNDGRYTLDINKNVFTLKTPYDGDNVQTLAAQTFSCPYSIFIGSANNAGSPMIRPPKMRFVEFECYKAGVLYKHLVPWQTLDGEIGMLDLVNNLFHGNAGSGKFIAG